MLRSGQALGKQTFGYLDYPRLSDSGHVAFMAMLSDGRTSVFVARPNAGKNKQDSLPSSSTPLSADSPLVKQLRGVYERAIKERHRQEPVASNAATSVPMPRTR